MAAKTFLVMAGGTGGHVFPALATARVLQEQGHRVHWLGSSQGMEVELIGQSGIPLSVIPARGLRGKGVLNQLLAPAMLFRSLIQAWHVVRQVRPDCVIGMGGFVTGPGGLAARLAGVPLVIHEQNAVAGMTNKLLARIASVVLEAFPRSFPAGVVTRLTGNPVRAELARLSVPEARLSRREGPLRVLVLGGSLGAQAINEMLPKALAILPAVCRPAIRHQCGRRHEEQTRADYAALDVQADIVPFITDMADAYDWADVVVCRAGALTVAELCAVGLGAILIPFPHAVDDHQTRNGHYMSDQQAATLIAQSSLSADWLARELKRLQEQRDLVLRMAMAARALGRLDATDQVVNICLEMAHA